MTTTLVGRYVITTEFDRTEGCLKYYDVILSRDGKEIHKISGCIGEKSCERWKEYLVKITRRLDFLYDNLDMACHNLLCYSKNYLMEEPKVGYEGDYFDQMKKVGTITEWIKEIESDLTGKVYRK
jgi:hypothetical protein